MLDPNRIRRDLDATALQLEHRGAAVDKAALADLEARLAATAADDQASGSTGAVSE